MFAWPQRIVVSEMPFAEDTGSVSCPAQHLSYRDFAGPHHGTAKVRVHHAGSIVIPAGQKARSRWRADWTNMKLSELGTFPGDPVHVRRSDLIVSVQADVAITLIVRHDQDNVGTRSCLSSTCMSRDGCTRTC